MQRLRSRLKILTLAACLGLALPGIARADEITNFHADVTVSHDNVATITETIVYDPQDSSHHGIFRYIPAQFKDSAGHTFYTTVNLQSVTDAQGRSYNIADKSLNRTQLYLKIGDPNQTIPPGPNTYVLTYTISPLVLKADGYDRLILNITGQQWQTDIMVPSADIHLDTPGQVLDAKCYTGAAGSTAHDCTAAQNGPHEVTVQSGGLNAGEGLTVDLKLSPGSVTKYLQPDVVPPFTSSDKAALALSLLALLLSLLALARIFWHWWQDRRERQDQVVIPLYEPPDGLSPAQMSILESPGSDVADITATLIDLAVRGFLKIEQTAPAAWYRTAKYRLLRLPGASGPMASYEAQLLAALFGGDDAVGLDSIKNNPTRTSQIRQAIQKMRSEIGNDLKTKGYYVTSPTLPFSIARLISAGVGLAASLVTIALVLGGQGYSWWPPIIALAGAAAGFGLTFLRTDRTLLGNEEWAKVEGFKLFMNVTEKDRLAFTDAPDKTPELFSKMLPYAVALKVERQWAKQFEGIDVDRSVQGWYAGAGFIDSSAFAGDLSSSFSGAVSSNFAGATGAGGAGGGGGGGGGGGW